MDAQEHRGADSNGVAICGPPIDNGYILRGMGYDKNRIAADMDDYRQILKDHRADFLEEHAVLTGDEDHYTVRMVISEPDDLAVKIEELRIATNWQVPIFIRMGRAARPILRSCIP